MKFNEDPTKKTSAIETQESLLAKKYGLVAGRKAVLEKVAVHGSSDVAVGKRLSGTLDGDLKVGQPLFFDNGASNTSGVRSVVEKNGDLYITRTRRNTGSYMTLMTLRAWRRPKALHTDIWMMAACSGSKRSRIRLMSRNRS